MIPRRSRAVNRAILMLAVLGSPVTEERESAPEGQCDGCMYKRMPSDGGHCYMFREEGIRLNPRS